MDIKKRTVPKNKNRPQRTEERKEPSPKIKVQAGRMVGRLNILLLVPLKTACL